jgi:arginine/lysine/ornithine decarboxylase
MTLENMPLVEGLLKYIDEKVTPFHMPGHKHNGRSFEELEIIRENLYGMDNTEVEGLDNLHIPEGIILEAEMRASRAFKSHRSFFLVNGSTSGIYSMILGVTRPGDKILVQRNCHRSIHMACLMGDLKTSYINPTVLDGFNAAVSLNINNAIEVMDNNRDARALVITYPTYYGTCSNLKKIIGEAHKRGMLVLVDEAHGAHFPFHEGLPKSAMELGADLSVMSLHKSTPALTQASLLNASDRVNLEGVKFMMRLFQSTSPSYVLMASLDASRNIMETRGKELLSDLLENTKWFREGIKNLGAYEVLDEGFKGKAHIEDIDLTKLVIKSQLGGRELDMILRRDYGIQVEMSDLYNIALIGSVGDTRESYEKLLNALVDISRSHRGYNIIEESLKMPSFSQALSMREAYYRPRRRVKFLEAEGLVSSEMIAPYPPGIPAILPGEVITYDIIEYTKKIKEKNIPLNGIEDSSAEYIYVVE